MHRSKAQSQQNMQKSRSRIARYKSLETSGVTAIKSCGYGAKEKRLSSKCSSHILNEASEVTLDSHQNVSSSTESSEKPGEFEFSPIQDEFSCYTGFREIVPSRFLPSATEIRSTDEERNIVAMPVEVTRLRDTDPDLKQLVYGRDFKNQMCIAEKSMTKRNAPYTRHDIHSAKEKTSDKAKEHEKGQKMMKRPMIPDGSYIISKENYIISKQARLPQEIIEEGRLRADRLTSAIAAGSTSEVVDNTKLIRFVTTACLVACVLALILVGWYWFFHKLVPTSGSKKMSLLRYYIEKSYEALLEIYE